MQDYSPHISVMDPVGPAIEHVKAVLFRPFDLERWLAIGFSAWLAQLGSGRGSNGGAEAKKHYQFDSLRDAYHQGHEYVVTNAGWLLPAVFIGSALVVGIWIMLTWLSSRGRFMFLYNVTYNNAEVRRPWAMFREYAHSLFLFRLVLALVGLVAVGALVAAGAFGTIALWQTSGPGALWTLFVLVPALIVVGLGLAMVSLFTTDFVLPVMLLQSTYCVPAWRQFRDLLSDNKGRFFLYLLFRLLIDLVVGVIVLLLVLLTCCCAACFLALPYIGTVVLLPIHVFKRTYALHYLRQYGSDYDLLGPVPPQTNWI